MNIRSARTEKYRFGFVLTTAAGNMTRYLNLRKYAERDPDVESVWAPVKHFLEPDSYGWLPGSVRCRVVAMHEAKPVMSQAGKLDIIMFHAFEPYIAALLRRKANKNPLIAWSQDNPPAPDPRRHPQYGGKHARSLMRQRLRFGFDQWCLRRTDMFFPFSNWAAGVLINDCDVKKEDVHSINVGLDLELWPYLPKRDGRTARPQILFVGGDFVRKGGDLLLRVYQQHFSGVADLHLVTKEPPNGLPAGIRVYTDLGANDPRLRQLYADADLFVLPTRADVSSWVALEAMATGRPVITTDTGGIPDIVREGQTGFVISPNDEAALTQRMQMLLASPDLRCEMGEAGRCVVERKFDASICVPRILTAMKEAVDGTLTPSSASKS